MRKAEAIIDTFPGLRDVSIQDYDWMITLKSDGIIEFFDREMDGIFTEELDPANTLFAQLYDIFDKEEIDQWDDGQKEPVVFIRCGEMVYLWEFTLAHYCFAKGRLTHQQFKEAIVYNSIHR